MAPAVALAYPPISNHPLFKAPIPNYGRSTFLKRLKWRASPILAFFLYMGGIFVIFLSVLRRYATHRTPKEGPRPFWVEERARKEARAADIAAWKKRSKQMSNNTSDIESDAGTNAAWTPTEGGKDRHKRDVGYYARRVGLDSEEIRVQTEDGHIILLWHIYDPREYIPMTSHQRGSRGAECIDDIQQPSRKIERSENSKPKYPVLLLHGLMQSSGVYCTNDDHSLAFWLCKQGYDVWCGNNRAGFKAEHIRLDRKDPNMWAWDIRHMGTIDLPALTARVLSETGFPQLALIAHSQGTAQTLIALAKDQRPSLGSKLSVACLLAPAAYAGPLLDRMHFKFARLVSVKTFRRIFGLTAFLSPLIGVGRFHGILPEKLIGTPSYLAYNALFEWGDDRWDRDVRDRGFSFAPTFISVEAMKWWLSKDGFAEHGCILSSAEQLRREEEEDALEDYLKDVPGHKLSKDDFQSLMAKHGMEAPSTNSEPWYDDQTPPFALWVAGKDSLCDGRKLLNRFQRGREPKARIVHSNLIEEYQHLDVVWSCDVIEKVGWELRDVIWKTASMARDQARIPVSCDQLQPWWDDRHAEREMLDAMEMGRERASIQL